MSKFCLIHYTYNIYICYKMAVVYVLQSKGIISRKLAALIVRYSQKWIFIVLYYSENPLIAHNVGTTGPIQVRFSAKCTSPNEHFNQIENWKCHMFKFWLISADPITYCPMLVDLIVPHTLQVLYCYIELASICIVLFNKDHGNNCFISSCVSSLVR